MNDNKGTGALWPSERWASNPRGPKYTGKIVADRPIAAGEEIPLAVFMAEPRSERQPVMRLTIDRWKERKAQEGGRKAAAAPRSAKPEFDDDIPW